MEYHGPLVHAVLPAIERRRLCVELNPRPCPGRSAFGYAGLLLPCHHPPPSILRLALGPPACSRQDKPPKMTTPAAMSWW